MRRRKVAACKLCECMNEVLDRPRRNIDRQLAHPQNHIGAVVKGWSGGPQCGQFVMLCNKDAGDHCVPVRIIDKCAGCKEDHGQSRWPHLVLTSGCADISLPAAHFSGPHQVSIPKAVPERHAERRENPWSANVPLQQQPNPLGCR
jgi:hypothetical protein